MFKWIRNRKAQNTAEYAILIGVIVATAIGIQTYVKRGLMGRVRDAVDHVGTGGDVGGADLSFTGEQFEPAYHVIENMQTSQGGSEAKGFEKGGKRSRTLTGYGITSKSGKEIEKAPDAQ